MKARVSQIDRIAAGVRRFTLVPEHGVVPAFSGGSHVEVLLPVGRRSYSLVSSPYRRDALQIAVRREAASRGGSAYLHDQVREGDALEISAPRNLFALVRPAPRHLLIAGGIGITPFVAQIESLRRWGATFELHYTFRGTEHAAFRPELQAAIGSRLHTYDTTADPRPDVSALLAAQPAGTHVSVCGPGELIDAVLAAATAQGWPRSHVHFERFHAGATGEARPFVARLARSGREVPVGPELSLLDALEGAGVAVPSSCRIGGCGTCEVAVAGGEIDHRDHCWTDEDRAGDRRLLACVSRARHGHLVLDL